MSVGDLASLPARTLAAMARERKASPVEIVDDALALIDRLEPRLNAFVVVDRDGARKCAQEAEAAVMRGAALGPLHGVPATIKDIHAVRGLPVRRGSTLTDATPAPADSPMVRRLREAGAVILGKTTMTENGWTAVSDSPLTGSTHNPWKAGHTSGGSSSGAAALAGAGCGPLHVGSDGAGSVRLPAHFCGVVGFKPTFGTVPYAPPPNNGALSHIGPITRDPHDAELMLEVMAGPHPADPVAHPLGYRRDPAEGASGLRIAFSPDLGHARVDPEVAESVARAARVFENLGAHVEETTPAWGPAGVDLEREVWISGFAAYDPADEASRAAMDPGLVACSSEGRGLSWAAVSEMQGRRLTYAAEIGLWFDQGWDLLLTPAASVVAFPHGCQRPEHWPAHDWDWLVWAEFSYPFNLSHCPAVSVPCGLSAEGLPIGLQIVGPRFTDPLVMRAARAFLEAQPFSYAALETL